MAEDLTPRRESGPVLAGRFRVIYGVLAVVLGGAVGTLIVLLGATNGGGGPAWSAWKPNGGSSDRASEIATFVSRHYRLDSGRQLVAVSVNQPPAVGRYPVKYLALSDGSSSSNISLMKADDTVAYILCGLGQNCAINEGQASVARGQLLRREALELALYTFKYVHGTDSVVAFLPPKPGTRPRFVLFFQKDDLNDELHRPLARTLAPQRRLTPATLGSSDSAYVASVVDRHVFRYTFGQAADGSVYLALQPPAL